MDVMDFDERYRAIASRDPRFDGQFVTAVTTTGIYCRPSCPARTPRPGNVRFFLTSAAAQEAGFRACKRCLPEAVPGAPEWNRRGDVAGRAMRLIAEGVIDREGVGGLAGRLGYSSRQLHRILRAEVGAPPLALARAQRAQTARALLTQTDLPVSQVAFASGFGSIRQCNDTIAAVFATTPGELRRRRVAGAPSGHGTLSLRLPVREPFDGRGLLAFLAERAVAGVESVAGDTYRRAVRLPSGPGQFALTLDTPGSVRLDATLADLSDLPVLVARVRRVFDLDADPVAVDTALAAQPELQARVRNSPGIRLPGALDAHEIVIRAVIGQQVTVAAARTSLARLAAAARTDDRLGAAGLQTGTPGGEVLIPFPAVARIAEVAPAVLRGPKARLEAVVRVAELLAEGDLTVSVGDGAGELRQRLEAVKGIGPWTAAYVAMRVLGDPDIWLPGDAAVRAGGVAVGVSNAVALGTLGRRCAPWRSYAVLHLWRAVRDGQSRPARAAAGSAAGVS